MKNNVCPNDLQVFLSVLDEGGFRAAAKRLGSAPSKISTTISRLERQLGVPLLLRTTRSVCPTEQGEALARRIHPLMAEMDAACQETARATERVHGRLRLNVPGALMPDILPPLIAALQNKHPDVEVEIVVENNLIDIVEAGCDAGIRYGNSIEKDMISIPIGPRSQQMALAAAPSYVEAHGQPLDVNELAGHSAIRYRLPSGPLLPWILRKEGKTATANPITRLVLSVNALNTGLSYAKAGLGIIYTFRSWLDDDLLTRKLIPVLPEWWNEKEGPRLYYPTRFTAPPLRAFIDVCQARS